MSFNVFPRCRGLVVAAVIGLTVVFPSASSAQGEACIYNAQTRAVTATIADGSTATLITVGGQLKFGFVPTACGAATTTNTDSIAISGATGSAERIVLDQSGGVFGPGFTGESNIAEIEISLDLGDLSDSAVVIGTAGADLLAPGQNGLAPGQNSIAMNTDGDLDVTVSPATMPLEFYGMGGNDSINGRGQNGSGLHYLGPLHIDGGEGDDVLLRGSSDPDVVLGGPGNDRLEGQASIDLLDGGSGADELAAGGGGDTLIGGPGPDTFIASDGNDLLLANDGEADVQLHGGPGTDTAYYESALDTNRIGVENLIDNSAPPTVTSFMPTSGAVGTLVTVTGSAFTGATSVTFGGASASYVVDSDSQISATVPAAATTGPIAVTTSRGTGTSAGSFTVPPPPAITSFAPTSGSAGTLVTVTGSAFTGATSVTFGGASASYVVDSGSQISATVPAAATTGPIAVTTPSGTGVSVDSFTVTAPPPPPTVTSFMPTSGAAGTLVTVTGSAFTGATSVTFGGASASYVVDSDSQISATVPAAATTGPIAVTTPGGTGTSADSFTVTEPPPGSPPAFGSAGAAATALGTSIEVPYPSGIAENDVLVLLVLTRDANDVNPPAGFAAGDARQQNYTLRAEWFWKRATGSETGTLTVTKAAGTALLMGRMYRYVGVATSGTPYEAAAQSGLGNSAVVNPADITTLGSNRRAVVLVAEGNDHPLGDFSHGAVPEETAEETTALGTDGALGINGVAVALPQLFDFGTFSLAAATGHIEFSLALLPTT